MDQKVEIDAPEVATLVVEIPWILQKEEIVSFSRIKKRIFSSYDVRAGGWKYLQWKDLLKNLHMCTVNLF